MSIKIGDLDVATEIIDLNFRLLRTQLILERVLSKNPSLVSSLGDISDIDKQVIEILQKKFPNMGIQRK